MINFNKIIKNTFCAAIFILPLFFIPGINYSQIINNKIAIFIFAVVLAVGYVLKALAENTFSIKHSWIQYIISWFLFLVTISTIFSKNILLSFWGLSDQADSLLFFAIYVLIFFIAVNIVKRKNTINILECFIASSAIISVAYLIQDFTKVKLALFESISTPAILISFALSIVISFVFNNINYFRSKGGSFNILKVAASGIFFILFIVSLYLMDYRISWFIVSVGTFFALWRVLMETNFSLLARKSLLLIIMLVGFLSIFFLSANSLSESALSYSDSWTIAKNTLTESAKNFLIGSGPSTYAYQFSLYENKDFNEIGLGSTVFNQSPIMILTMLPTIGVLGVIPLFLAMILFYIKGFKYFLSFKRRDNDLSINPSDILFPMAFSASLLLFFYRIDAILMVFIFLFIGLWVNSQAKEEGVFEVLHYYRRAAYLSFLILIIIIFNFISYCRGQIVYADAFDQYNNGADIDQSINKIEKASKIWNITDASITLSQLYAIKASDIFLKKEVDANKKQQDIKDLVNKAETISSYATKIDIHNFQAWQNLGLVYENTSYVLEDRTDSALEAYANAEKLAPQNESIYIAEGRLLQTKGNLEGSLVKYEKANYLNPTNEDTVTKIKELEYYIKIKKK